MQQKYH